MHVRYLKLRESRFEAAENIRSGQHCVILAVLQLQMLARALTHLLGSKLIVWSEGMGLYHRTCFFFLHPFCSILPLSPRLGMNTWLELQKQTGRLSSANYMHSQ